MVMCDGWRTSVDISFQKIILVFSFKIQKKLSDDDHAFVKNDRYRYH
jgi:hypothetical protein